MLDKMKVILFLGLVIQILRVVLPDLDFGSEFEGAAEALVESIYVLVPIVAGWFTPESRAQIARLKTRG